MWWKNRVYLDSAAGCAPNPSSPHEEGRQAKKVLENARVTIARLFEVQSDDVLFTSGATESNALAILGHIHALRILAGSDTAGRNNMHVLYLPSAHASVVENVQMLAEEGIAIEPLPIRDARVDSEALSKMIRKETVLVAMDAVCGETGVVWNTREVADVLRKARTGGVGTRIVLHVDASQAPLTEKVTRDHFGADTLAFDGSKVARVHGIGALVAHRTIPLSPLYRGGGQERGLRSGTESPELAATFARALHTTVASREAFRATASVSREKLIARILKEVPSVYVNEGRSQAPNILNLSFPGRDTDYLAALLNEAGFAVSTRSACETDSQMGSRAVFILTGDQERAQSTLRISWGKGVSMWTLRRFSKALARAVRFIDESSKR